MLFALGTAFCQSTKSNSITISKAEFQVYANGLIKVEELKKDTSALHQIIYQLSDIVESQSVNLHRDSLIYKNVNQEISIYKNDLNSCNEKYSSAQSKAKKRGSTTLILLTTTIVEALVIYLTIKK
jgi:RNA-binding protein YhbY